MSHSEASGPHNPYRPSKRRQPEPLKEDKEGWEKMCGYVDKIASSWGYDNKYNDGLWTPSEWAEGWKYIVSLEAWNKLTNPVHRENALRYLDPSKTFPADIFNPNFPSVESLNLQGFALQARQRVSISWYRKVTWKLFKRWYHNGPRVLDSSISGDLYSKLLSSIYSKLSGERKGQTDYDLWLQGIKIWVGKRSSSEAERSIVLRLLGTCYKLLKATQHLGVNVVVKTFLPRVKDLGEFIKDPKTLEALRPVSPPRPRQAVPSHSQTSSHSTTKRPYPLNLSTTTRNKRPSITRSDSSSSGFGPQLSHHFASPVTPSHESPFFASPTSSIMDLPPALPSYSALARRDSQSSQFSDPPQVPRESFASRRFTPQNDRSSFSSERSDDLNNSLSSLPEIPRSHTTGEFRIPEAPASFSSTRQSPYPFTQRQRTGSSSSTASSAPGQAQTSNPFVLYDSRVPPPPPLSTGSSAPSAPQAPSSPRLESQAKAVLHRFTEAYGSDISADYNLQRLCAIVGGSNLTESEAQDVSNYCEMLTNADPLHLPLTLELPRNLFEIRDCARQNKIACHPLSFNFGQQ